MSGLGDLIDTSYGIVNDLLIPIAFSLALLYFFWGVSKYVGQGASSDKAASEGKRIMGWGVIALFVAFSVWGIIRLIQSELGLPPIDTIEIVK